MSNYAWVELPPALKAAVGAKELVIGYENINGTGEVQIRCTDVLADPAEMVFFFMGHEAARAWGEILIQAADEARYHQWFEFYGPADRLKYDMNDDERRAAYGQWKADTNG